MQKVILICGKICSGKSTYAGKLRMQEKAVVLSCDEITLALFDQTIGHNHDVIVEKTQTYLFTKSVEILRTDINVILDWGFWTKVERDYAKTFYKENGISCELHYVNITDKTWKANLSKRNWLISEGKTSAYFVDENLAKKFQSIFELPSSDEIDVMFNNEW